MKLAFAGQYDRVLSEMGTIQIRHYYSTQVSLASSAITGNCQDLAERIDTSPLKVTRQCVKYGLAASSTTCFAFESGKLKVQEQFNLSYSNYTTEENSCLHMLS